MIPGSNGVVEDEKWGLNALHAEEGRPRVAISGVQVISFSSAGTKACTVLSAKGKKPLL
jgi:hypothetical protein